MKRVFGIAEGVFDILYLMAAVLLGFLLCSGEPSIPRFLAGIMAFVLAGGDAFHLVPRMITVFTRQEEAMRTALGRGKQITSITMTVFYLILWQIGLLVFPLLPTGLSWVVYGLAACRILLCLLPQNRWQDRYPPLRWGIWRNLPFFLLGLLIAGVYFANGSNSPHIFWIGVLIIISFGCYLPVVIWANENPKVGMLMLPKTCAYIGILALCLCL